MRRERNELAAVGVTKRGKEGGWEGGKEREARTELWES